MNLKLKTTCAMVLFFLTIGTFVFAIEDPINTSITDSTWTAVSLGSGQTCSAYAIQSRDGTAFKISKSSSGAPYWTVKEDGGLSPTKHHGVAGATLFYAQSSSGNIVVEVFILNE